MRKILSVLLSCMFVILLSGCFYEDSANSKSEGFQTEYTEEEHIARLTERTREKFATEIESGEIIDFEIEIVYSFYDHYPRYFLVQWEYVEEFTDVSHPESYEYTSKYKHMLGLIKNDQYYTDIWGYFAGDKGGVSPYDYLGHSDAKKYYGTGGVFGVETDEGILQIYQCTNTTSPVGLLTEMGETYKESFEQKLLVGEDQKYLRSPGFIKIYSPY